MVTHLRAVDLAGANGSGSWIVARFQAVRGVQWGTTRTAFLYRESEYAYDI